MLHPADGQSDIEHRFASRGSEYLPAGFPPSTQITPSPPMLANENPSRLLHRRHFHNVDQSVLRARYRSWLDSIEVFSRRDGRIPFYPMNSGAVFSVIEGRDTAPQNIEC